MRGFSFPDDGEALLTITIPIIENWRTGGDSRIPNAWRQGCPLKILPLFSPVAERSADDDYKRESLGGIFSVTKLVLLLTPTRLLIRKGVT